MDRQVLFSFGENEFRSIIKEVLTEHLHSLHSSQPKEENNQERFATRQQVAQALNISLPTLNDYTKKGKLTAYRIGSRVLYKWPEVEEALLQIHRPGNKKAL